MEEKIVFSIANLARLKLSEEEVETFPKQFMDIVSFIENLGEVNTDNVPPFYELIVEETSYREDTPISLLKNEEALLNAPKGEGGFFVVPRVVG
ncbi:MAG: Asp-tRNA(Asn)/Glu-tRNA(Gln) amidotransferase subunit GatC [Hydrogenothermaceae bacterium]|nr:Asp-tRNA(Asn)/Glu-tRNA(Gln) amidotransferase subunit GatC [Hydrogenothermaceae bacterium]